MLFALILLSNNINKYLIERRAPCEETLEVHCRIVAVAKKGQIFVDFLYMLHFQYIYWAGPTKTEFFIGLNTTQSPFIGPIKRRSNCRPSRDNEVADDVPNGGKITARKELDEAERTVLSFGIEDCRRGNVSCLFSIYEPFVFKCMENRTRIIMKTRF